MDTPLTVMTERVDDIPLLLAQLQRMEGQPLLDDYFPTRDGDLDVYRANERGQWVSGAVLVVQVIHHETQKSFLHHQGSALWGD